MSVADAIATMKEAERVIDQLMQQNERYRKALENAARECGLQAGAASHCDDTHGVRAWSELQHELDAALRRK